MNAYFPHFHPPAERHMSHVILQRIRTRQCVSTYILK